MVSDILAKKLHMWAYGSTDWGARMTKQLTMICPTHKALGHVTLGHVTLGTRHLDM